MRGDARMRWLVDARNQIEKQGDLETCSIALASVLLTDGEDAVSRVEVPPLASPAEIAAAVKLKDLPERVRKQAVMAVERRWTVPELVDNELLDTIAYCYGILATIVVEAHERCGISMRTFGGEMHEDCDSRQAHPSGRLPCMLPTAEKRTAYWHLGEKTLMRHVTTALQRSGPRALQQAAERYGLAEGKHQLIPGLPLQEQASAMHAVGKRILEIDGSHHSFGDSGRR
jgi:hypothetical protein